MTQSQGKLRQIELDIVLSEHNLLGEPGEEITAAKKVEDKIKFTLGLKKQKKIIIAKYLLICQYLKCILEPNDE